MTLEDQHPLAATQTNTTSTRSDILLVVIILLGLTGIFALSRSLDNNRVFAEQRFEEEELYLTGDTLKRMSLAFNGLAADWYWMRSLQYVGGKILNLPDDAQLYDLEQLDLRLLAPLLDTATTLDPQFLEPYEYAAMVLSGIQTDEAVRIIKKGIDSNPSAWRLYQHLGYIHWQQKDFKAASEAYGKGAGLPDAPSWMEAMSARMAAEGGSRATAREIYQRMYEEAVDNKVREMARRRLFQVDSLEERDVLRKVIAGFQSKTGRCPASWQEIAPVLSALSMRVDISGVPLDPSGTPYLLVKCEVELDPKSEVPQK